MSAQRQLVSKIIEDIKNGKLKWEKRDWLGCVEFSAALSQLTPASVSIFQDTRGLRFLRKTKMYLVYQWGEVNLLGWRLVDLHNKRTELNITKEEGRLIVDSIKNQLSCQESQEEIDLIKSLLQ